MLGARVASAVTMHRQSTQTHVHGSFWPRFPQAPPQNNKRLGKTSLFHVFCCSWNWWSAPNPIFIAKLKIELQDVVSQE